MHLSYKGIKNGNFFTFDSNYYIKYSGDVLKNVQMMEILLEHTVLAIRRDSLALERK
jgi:hypothetical protein